ncbi:tRNA uridine-5-carboxymethylaminomethyl(34) synthesis enzyme MnmG [Ruminococcus sp.]|uniref:tRNA uridine-5-carboxymethylaminomethyl(34) synthesis enzyme MnmG n=1 Tax=Ruminococcus sp. TaxID=41978 RepID=UPI0025E891A4|nr:tRNA uridine-5-carboxymethylaminomethyl(34) synthesis enzyme MnmG [Ruminococcus sp.]MBQ8966833.1 tRNA uridine-5-carboxymethylaminomethyl(34) synthesis enzyme MnmG [Ruminococcus sp.]
MENFDIIVIGAGHAGCEAALAGARMGLKTALFTITLDGLANMPCNPSIGGTAKGHLVREIDALGGEMGRAADKTLIQSRMLNRGKGPAVHSLRAQIDRVAYHNLMKKTIEATDGLYLKQAEITYLIFKEDGRTVCGVRTHLGVEYGCKAVIIASGTYLNGEIHVGTTTYASGPDSVLPARKLSDSLKAAGMTLRRFKTGTPARVHRRSINFDKLEVQHGDEDIQPFSFTNEVLPENKVDCYVAYTNADTHKVIMDNIHLSPIYSGRIHAIGPRYCPSIEDKIMRFSDKPRHQLFIEPMGLDTDEFYLQGMSSSLPVDVQLKFLRTIEGLENVEIMRNAYAIEYDCCDPTDLLPTLEFKEFHGVYGAGQFNGTSGYEEAAAQGLAAGINAALKLKGEEPMVLDRASSYIGTLIDDLCTKGVSDPYRMLTSRSEYRLLLRQDNADLRLTETGHRVGLVDDERYAAFLKKKEQIEAEIKRISGINIAPSDKLNEYLVSQGTDPINNGFKLTQLIRRPQLSYKGLAFIDPERPELPDDVCEQVELMVKYEGYIKIQLEQVEAMRKLESRRIPEDIDYSKVGSLRLEAAEKLAKIRPLSVGQASRISGVNPADINVLLVYLEVNGKA